MHHAMKSVKNKGHLNLSLQGNRKEGGRKYLVSNHDHRPSSSGKYPCNICGTDSKVLGFKRGVKALRCPSCGFIWKDTKSLPQDYRKTWSYGSPESFEIRNMDAVFEYRLKEILEKSGCEVKKIMDFGCGKGDFVNYLRKRGYEAYGCDVGDNIPAGAFFFKKNISDVPKYDFDVIVSIETFEHIEGLNPVVTELAKRLRKDGMLYIQTHFTHVDSVLAWCYFDLANHISFHSPSSMKRLLDNAGMDLIYFDARKQPKNTIWWLRKLVHLYYRVTPNFLQQSKFFKAAAPLVMKVGNKLLEKIVPVQPCKDYVAWVLEKGNCVFVGIKR